MKLRDIMTSNVKSLTPDSSIQQAAQLMKDLDVGSIPVCEGQKPVGIVTDRDITIRSIADGEDINTPVNRVMTNQVVTGSPEMTDEEAAQLMAKHQIRRLPVVENDNLVGIVSLGDLAVNEKTDMEAAKALSTISFPSKPQKK